MMSQHSNKTRLICWCCNIRPRIITLWRQYILYLYPFISTLWEKEKKKSESQVMNEKLIESPIFKYGHLRIMYIPWNQVLKEAIKYIKCQLCTVKVTICASKCAIFWILEAEYSLQEIMPGDLISLLYLYSETKCHVTCEQDL